MEQQQLPTRSGVALLASLALAVGVAGCGSNDGGNTATSAAQQQTATQTQTQTDTQPGSTDRPQTSTTRTEQKEAVVNGDSKTLKSGSAAVTLKVDKLIDPVKTVVDLPQKGNKLVGVVLTGQRSGKFEPSKTSATAVLNTTDGTAANVRVIADGDCSGAFFPGAILSSPKQEKGCVGFEVPSTAEPTSITIRIQSVNKPGQQATWDLPKAG